MKTKNLVWLGILTGALFAIMYCGGKSGGGDSETECSDQVDNDGDGDTDCFDGDCSADPYCASEANCIDQFDNDADGLTDCQDDDCANNPTCLADEICDNAMDDDNDGLTDCFDEECTDFPACTGPCNNDSICDSGEECTWCADCCGPCALNEGDNTDYIVSAVVIPEDDIAARSIGVDLDDDGSIDNKLGQIISVLPFDPNYGPNEILTEMILDGYLIVILRLVVSAWPTDEHVAAQILGGDADPTHDATEDNLSGSGHVLIDDETNRNLYLCGDLLDNFLTAGPGTIQVPLWLYGNIVFLPVDRARMVSDASMTVNGFSELMVGGGLTQDTLNNHLIPGIVDALNDEVIARPTGAAADYVLTSIDAGCDTTPEGCASVVNGQGECAAWTGDPNDPPLTATEIRCNLVLSSALTPDVDADHDGINELVSLGIKISGIPVTVDN